MALIVTNLDIEQGADYAHEWQWLVADDEGQQVPRDLTGYVGRLDVRRHAADTTTLTTAHSLTDTPGNITLSADGVVRVEWAAAVSSGWLWRTGVYDLELVDPDGGVTRFASGLVHVSAEVTRSA